MNFYLILPSYDVKMEVEQEVRIISGATLYHVFPSPDNKSYNLYELKYTPQTYSKIFFRWPKKRISREFIEVHFKYQVFYKSMPGETIRELAKNMNCENYILVQ
jgi:hypothetical protein